MKRPLSIAFFVHSLRSDWNNGNAHFLRGLARELARMGHRVRCYEQEQGWSYVNLFEQEGAAGEEAIARFENEYRQDESRALDISTYSAAELTPHGMRELLHEVDIAIVHEWNEPALVNLVLDAARKNHTTVLFHDTHHRASSTPQQMRDLQIERFDGVLVFGEALRTIYRERWGVDPVWTLHEAADTSVFYPVPASHKQDVIWVGNWGDEERTSELRRYLIEPAKALPLRRFTVYGVRYPDPGRAALADAGIDYRGYLPNLSAPCVYGESRLTLHVPRRYYAESLPGIPTIRVFEALACGIPLISAPWSDSEHLFRDGDFRMVHNTQEMVAAITELLEDNGLRREQAAAGLETVLARHTCAHRAAELTAICEELQA